MDVKRSGEPVEVHLPPEVFATGKANLAYAEELAVAGNTAMTTLILLAAERLQGSGDRPQKPAAEPLVDPGDVLASLPDDAVMNHADLADRLKVDRDALRKRLELWRRDNADGWQEILDAKPREPKYLYRIGAIRHLLRDAI